jgi:hypothetical protein
MPRLRRKLLWLAAVVIVLVPILIPWLLSRPQPQAVYRLRAVRAHVMPARPPGVTVQGNRMVEAEFEYVGPPLAPPTNFRRLLNRANLTAAPPDVRWFVEDIVMVDEQGRELSKLAPGRSTTRPSAHGGFSEDRQKRQLVHLWTFDLPAGIDPSTAVTFRTRLGVNDHPPVLVEVTLPRIPRSRAASQPATDATR